MSTTLIQPGIGIQYTNQFNPNIQPAIFKVGQPYEGLFRFGQRHAGLARDGRHAWAIDLYQRKAKVTGKASACEIPFFPSTDSVVRVKGQILDSDKGMALWIREMAPEECVGTDICALDLATPNWVVDQSVVDSFSQIWSTLTNPYRELINAVLSEPDVMHGFLQTPGSVRHHDAMTGGCIAHTIRVAKMAICFAEITPALDRDMLVAGAILHRRG